MKVIRITDKHIFAICEKNRFYYFRREEIEFCTSNSSHHVIGYLWEPAAIDLGLSAAGQRMKACVCSVVFGSSIHMAITKALIKRAAEVEV